MVHFLAVVSAISRLGTTIRVIALALCVSASGAFADSEAAPSGAAQFSSLLSGYPIRPDWKVAGVDYYVGVPVERQLKDPATISAAGVAVDRSAHVVKVSAPNVVLSEYDFGLDEGWQVDVVDSASNVTIQNSHFRVGANNLIPIQAYYGGSINVLNNTFDGGASRGSTVNGMVFTGTGGATIKYNRFTNFPDDGIDITRDGDFTISNNLFDTMGALDYHTDAIQTYFGEISSLSIEYNTMYQPPSVSNGGINSFVRIGDQRGHVVRGAVAAYNTIVMASRHAETANVFQWQGQDGVGSLVDPVIHDNFIDPTGVMYAIIAPMLQDAKSVINPVTYGNVNLKTRKQLLSGPWNNSVSAIPPRAPVAPIILTGSPVGTAQTKLAGTAVARATVAIYDERVLLGTTKAGDDGTWSFVTPELGGGRHQIEARATTALTNSSALSIPLIAVVTPLGVAVDRRRSPPASSDANEHVPTEAIDDQSIASKLGKQP